MYSSKDDAIAQLIAAKFPLFSTDLQRAAQRVCNKNGGPLAFTPNLKELAETHFADLRRMLRNSHSLQFDETTDLIFEANNLRVTQRSKDYIIGLFVEVNEFRSSLRELTDDELQRELEAFRESACLQETRQGYSDDKYAFFSAENASASFDDWIRLPAWTVEEAAALSLGRDPDAVNIRTINLYPKASASPFCKEFNARVRMINRCVEASILNQMITPKAFLDWCKGSGISVPEQIAGNASTPNLLELQKKCGLLEAEILVLREEHRRSSDTNNRHKLGTIYRLLLGMAISRFEHRTDKNSKATGSIEECLLDLQQSAQNLNTTKISVSNDSIRSVLNEAARELEFEWSEEIKWRGTRRL